MSYKKIVNDPLYGFITIDDALVYEVISHPFYQRLRRIHQMAMADLVYPGAVHTRLHHSLGAYHLMCNALAELERKGITITHEEKQGAKIAILLHDIGHGPYSHALEKILIEHADHEKISRLIMEKLNEQLSGRLQLAIDIFNGVYIKRFLHQLISGQLDVDRMDYLIRDSFFTGVSEGVIGYDRIIKMMTVQDGELMVEEKGIYSIEKFLVSRRFMYWQVYLHKTVLCAEKMLVRIIRRAKEIKAPAPSEILNKFLNPVFSSLPISDTLDDFCQLDDYDIMCAIKKWAEHPDRILSFLCRAMINRKLLKIKFSAVPFADSEIEVIKEKASLISGIALKEINNLVFTGEAVNKTYNTDEDHIRILFKNGHVKNISEVDNPLINQTLFTPIKKFYICYPDEEEVVS